MGHGCARGGNGLVLTQLALGPGRACFTVRSVAYDRGGLGWSRRSRRPRDAQTIATDCEMRCARRRSSRRTCLPVIPLVGCRSAHSQISIPADRWVGPGGCIPSRPVGALADAARGQMLEVSQRIFGWLGWLGVLRAINLSRGISAGLPARQVAELRAGAALPGFAATEAAQIHSWSVSREQLKPPSRSVTCRWPCWRLAEQPVGGELLTALQGELAELPRTRASRSCRRQPRVLISNREHARVVATAIREVTDQSPWY